MRQRGLPVCEAVWRTDNLHRAYARYARQRGLWLARLPMARVAKAPVGPMLELADDMRCGRYLPRDPVTIPVAKADGGHRDIVVYMMRDRIAQRALLQVLQDRTDAAMSETSFGFRPGRGVARALADVNALMGDGYCWIGDADIERCFDSIPRGPLLKQVARRLRDRTAPELVCRYLGWHRHGQRNGVGIPQGSVLAPWLCNIYLWQLDDRMREAGVPMVRYADDFLLMARNKEEANRALSLCSDILGELRLRLHPIKTRIADALAGFSFLGRRLQLPAALSQAQPILAA